MTSLPKWVYDLLADLIDEEDMHPKLYADLYNMAAGKHQMTPYGWCPKVVLDKVPADVMVEARAIAQYRGPRVELYAPTEHEASNEAKVGT